HRYLIAWIDRHVLTLDVPNRPKIHVSQKAVRVQRHEYAAVVDGEVIDHAVGNRPSHVYVLRAVVREHWHADSLNIRPGACNWLRSRSSDRDHRFESK